MRLSFFASTALCVSLSLVSAEAANAQSGAENQAGSAESSAPQERSDPHYNQDEVVITATRRLQRLRDVPISASVISGNALSESQLRNVEDLAARLPNIKIATAPVSDQLHIRGVGSSLNLGFEQSVATFVDGVYRGRSRATRAALFDVERVELLRGPQTTFFGNNAIAGALNITTRLPGAEQEGNALAFYAPDTEEYTLEGGVSIPVSETFGLRVAARANGMDGYVHNSNLDEDAPHIEEQIGRISVRWSPPGFETKARVDLGRSRNDGILELQPSNCPSDDPVFGAARGACSRYLIGSGGAVDDTLDGNTASNPSHFDYDYLEAAQTTSIDLGAGHLIFTTGYFDHDYDLLNDVNAVPARFGSVVNTTQTQPARFLETFDQFSQEVRFESRTGEKVDYLLGAYYSQSDLDVDGFLGFFQAPVGALSGGVFTPATPIAVRVRNTESSETLSAFAAATVNWSERFRMNLGLRYSTVTKEASRIAEIGSAGSVPDPSNFVASAAGTTNLGPALGVNLGGFANPEHTDDALMPTVGVQYDLTPDIMAYVSYTRGFKAGGYSSFVSRSEFGPETVDAYEVGMKASFFDGRFAFNLAIFSSEYSDLQETTTIP